MTNKRKTNFYYVSSGHSEVLIAKTGIISVEGVRFQASDAIDFVIIRNLFESLRYALYPDTNVAPNVQKPSSSVRTSFERSEKDKKQQGVFN